MTEQPEAKLSITRAAEEFSKLLDEIERKERKVPGMGPLVRASEAVDVVKEAKVALLRETDAEGFVYHADSDGLMSAFAHGEKPCDVPELLSTRWHARREYDESEVATVDFVTPHHPGIDHKRPSPDVHREDHVIVPSTSMAEIFGPKGQTLSWATSDIAGMATPYDIVAVAEFMESTRGTFEDVLRDVAALKLRAKDELSFEIIDRIDPEDLPAPKFETLELPGGARVAVADYGTDEAIALAPMSPCDIVLGKKYAWIGNPVALMEELRTVAERIHLRKVIEQRIARAKRLPTFSLPPAGVGFFPWK